MFVDVCGMCCLFLLHFRPPQLFKGLRLTAGHRPSNDVWLMVWEDWAEILRADPGRAMLNWGRHNAQCLPVWKQSGPMLSAGCAHVGPSRAHVGPSWAHLGLMLAKSGSCWAMLGPSWAYIGPGWAYVGLSWAHVGPLFGLCWGQVWAIYVETLLRCEFFRPGLPPGAQNHVKTEVLQHRQDEIPCRRRVKNDVF